MTNQTPNPNYKMIMIAVIVLLVVGIGGWFVFSGDDGIKDSGSGRSLGVPAQDGGDEVSGDTVPAFSLQDYEGKTVALRDFAGKPVVLNSWAAWCPFCVDELPDFATVQAEFTDIPIVAIDRAESVAVAKEYTDEIGVTDQLIFLMDPKDSFYKSIGGFAMPETLFVNSDGTINFHKRGPMRAEEIRERISELK